MYSLRDGAPMIDDQSDITLISGSEVDGQTSVTFKRRLNTCDQDHDYVIVSDTMNYLDGIR